MKGAIAMLILLLNFSYALPKSEERVIDISDAVPFIVEGSFLNFVLRDVELSQQQLLNLKAHYSNKELDIATFVIWYTHRVLDAYDIDDRSFIIKID